MNISPCFTPIITKPTRSHGRSNTLIDNIFTNNYSSIKETGTVLSNISDHYPLYVTIQNELKEKYHMQTQRQFTKSNFAHFIDCIKVTSWNSLMELNSAQESYSALHKILTHNFVKAFPLKTEKNRYHSKLPR